MSHYDCTKNRFNPQNRFVGDIEDGKRYPFACYTKEESDERYARKSLEIDVEALEQAVSTKASQAYVTALETQINSRITDIQTALNGKASQSDVNALSNRVSELSVQLDNKADKYEIENLKLIINAGAAALQAQTERIDDLELRVAALEKSLVILTFTASPTYIELGSNSTVNLAWSLNKEATTQTINGEAVTGTTKQYTNVSETTSYLLTVSDGSATVHKTATVTAANQIYYGADTDLSNVTSLSKVLSNDKERRITVNAGAGEYIIYAYPARLGEATFYVGAWEGGFEPAVEMTLTNASGYAETYKVYRSTNPNLGETVVDIKEG